MVAEWEIPKSVNPESVGIAQDQITELVRVSTTAVYRVGRLFHTFPDWMFETRCFSDDKRQRSFQIVHGHVNLDYKHGFDTMTDKAVRTHEHIVNNLRRRFDDATKGDAQ